MGSAKTNVIPEGFAFDPLVSRHRETCPVCGRGAPYLFTTAVDRLRRIEAERWNITRCRRCGFGWTEPLIREDEIAAYYPATYLGAIEERIRQYLRGEIQKSRSWRGELEKVRLVEEHIPGGRLLDVGCGEGKFLWALDPDRWRRAGVELSSEAVRLVSRHIPGIDMLAGDIFHAALDSGSFDVITFWHALEHLPDPARALRRAATLLRPGGIVVVSLPSIDSLQAALFRTYWYGFDDVPRHLHHFSRDALDLLLAACGFKVERHLMFSKRVNFHALKHSLRNWADGVHAGRLCYYTLKPLLWGLELLEGLSGRYGIRTVVAQRLPHEGHHSDCRAGRK